MKRLATCLGMLALAGVSWQSAAAQDMLDFDAPISLCDEMEIVGQSAGACVGHCHCGCCSFWSRPTLTGDWLGRRSQLQESGVTFAGRSTHFAFGVDGGIVAPPVPALGRGDTFKYTGRGEYDLVFDLEKFGGLPYGSLLVRAEHWHVETH
jgi:porin